MTSDSTYLHGNNLTELLFQRWTLGLHSRIDLALSFIHFLRSHDTDEAWSTALFRLSVACHRL